MKALIQRVSEASVTVQNQSIAAIKTGLLIFIGIHQNDTPKERDWMIQKTSHLRLFPDTQGKLNKTIQDIKGDLLIVPQFTLCGDIKKGTRPNFSNAMAPNYAKPFFDDLIQTYTATYPHIQTGEFGAHMHVNLINDGPVTLWLETP